MIPWTSLQPWQFCGPSGNGSLTICEACKEVVPVFFVEGFIDPVLEGAIFINGVFRDIREKETKIIDNVVLLVEIGAPDLTNVVAARSHHLLGWLVGWSTHGLPKKIKLASSNHVANAGDVVEHSPHMLIVKVLVLNSEH